jgi:hypothetical protein
MLGTLLNRFAVVGRMPRADPDLLAVRLNLPRR